MPYPMPRRRSVTVGAGGCLGLIVVVVVLGVIVCLLWAWAIMLVAGAMQFKVNGRSPGFWTVMPLAILLDLIIGAISVRARHA
jgi:hypothetical protein